MLKIVLGFLALVGPFQGLQGSPVHKLNNRPVIGLVAQTTSTSMKHYGDEIVQASYVKFLELAGAKVVAIKGEQPESYYRKLFKRINGILLPGGNASLTTSPFARTSRILYSLAIEANDKGVYFPIWGTCQGFEMLSVLTTGTNLMKSTDSWDLSLPLKLLAGYKMSRLLSNASADIIKYLTEEPIAVNYHYWSLLTTTFQKTPSLREFYRVISVNHDRKGVPFVSTYEAYKYPFYGVQWHPEKNIFSWTTKSKVDHAPNAVKVAQYMTNFFVDEARRNDHAFTPEEEVSKRIVENNFNVYVPKTFNQYYFYNVTTNKEKFK